MDLVAGFHSEGIDGPMYGQAKTAATIRFLWNRGVPTTVNLEPRTNGLQALVVIREFYENGEDLYLLPDMFNLTGTSKQRFAFLPVFGSVNDIAFSVALTNNSPIAHEEINVKKYIDESEIYDDGGRFNTKFLNMGLGLKTKILKSLKSGCNFLFASKR